MYRKMIILWSFSYKSLWSFATSCDNIRIHHECEGGIEKSVPRIDDWHHEACRVMTNGDREGQIFFIPSSHE